MNSYRTESRAYHIDDLIRRVGVAFQIEDRTVAERLYAAVAMLALEREDSV